MTLTAQLRPCPRLVVAGTASGTGKTSVALGLVSALKERGLQVQTFKVGPDFLDPSYLALASGRPCYNLDGWMCGHDYTKTLFARTTRGADAAVIEGVMGLFDGADAASLSGSTAEIATWLDAPVLLVVSAHGAARSFAATVYGFVHFEPIVRIDGVVVNHCGSASHAELLADALRAAGLPPLLGSLADDSLPVLPSRHLGLVTANDDILTDETLRQFARALEQQVSMDAVLHLARSAPALPEFPATVGERPAGNVRIAVARDKAFHFYYPDNLEALESAGAELAYFSPLKDACLPDHSAGVYIGGGYPEMYAAQLASNRSMSQTIRVLADAGHPVYAECGGLMYLSQGIETQDGIRHELVGLLPVWTRMLKRRKALGYVEAVPLRDSLLAPGSAVLRGHEFHYSEIAPLGVTDQQWVPAYATRRRRGTECAVEGFHRGNVLASYVHVHFASHLGAASRFVRLCQESTHGA
jgi:cobyrinic acid a,c-diamide synthase